MKAIAVQRGPGEGPPSLVWEDVPDVSIGPDEALVEMRAAGVNRADLAQARGGYAPPPGASDTIGLEVSGDQHAGASGLLHPLLGLLGVRLLGLKVVDRHVAALAGEVPEGQRRRELKCGQRHVVGVRQHIVAECIWPTSGWLGSAPLSSSSAMRSRAVCRFG